MLKQNYQKKQPLDYNFIEQLEMATAESGFALFFENKKLTGPMFVQISVLKKFFEIYKKNSGYQCTDEIEIRLFNQGTVNKYLEKILNLSYPKDCKRQERIKLDQQVFIPAILLVKIQALLSQLDDKKNDINCKIFFRYWIV